VRLEGEADLGTSARSAPGQGLRLGSLGAGLTYRASCAVASFDGDAFIQSCIEASTDSEPVSALREAVARAVSDPQALERTYPIPLDADDDGVLYRSPSLFIANPRFPRGYRTGIHNHLVAAVVGLWGGYEDNYLYRPTSSGVETAGSQRVHVGEVLVLGPDTIHDVAAPTSTWSSALHVYLGDIAALERSYWSHTGAEPARYNGAKVAALWTERASATGLLSAPLGDRPG